MFTIESLPPNLIPNPTNEWLNCSAVFKIAAISNMSLPTYLPAPTHPINCSAPLHFGRSGLTWQEDGEDVRLLCSLHLLPVHSPAVGLCSAAPWWFTASFPALQYLSCSVSSAWAPKVSSRRSSLRLTNVENKPEKSLKLPPESTEEMSNSHRVCWCCQCHFTAGITGLPETSLSGLLKWS